MNAQVKGLITMNCQVSHSELNKLNEENLNLPSKNQDEANFSTVKLHLMPKFTKFGTLELAENVLPLHLFRKVSSLFSSVVDAKKVLLSRKAVLSTVAVTDLEYNCLTPLAASKKLPMVFYKREDLTSIKAYKVRGALYQMQKALEDNPDEDLRFVAASTGNHALGVLKSAEILKLSNVTICISENVTEFKKEKLRKKISALTEHGVDAKLVIKGHTFDETNAYAQELVAQSSHGFYVDPYNTHNAVAGQGTIGLEILSQLEKRFFDFSNNKFDIKKANKLKEFTVIVPMGGGGLISGISCALKAGMEQSPYLRRLKLKVIGVKLDSLDSKYGDAIKVEAFGEHNQELINYLVDEQVEITDVDMKRGIDFIKTDLSVKVEGASAGTLKPVLDKLVTPSERNAVVCILSGGNACFS